MANGAMVISEPSYRPDPFVEGEHFISATIEEMPEAIRYYLAHPEERERVVAAGHRLVTQELTWRRTMEEMLAVIRSRIAGRGPLSGTRTSQARGSSIN
jgi:spore maturation protein CgeB